MRNTRFGDVRPTSPLRALLKLLLKLCCLPYRCGLRAREGVGEPLTSARAIEIASEIGGRLYSLPAPRPRGGAAPSA